MDVSVKEINNDFTFVQRPRIVRSGESYFNLLEQMIRNAKTNIHIQFYIIEPDETGNFIFNLLEEKAKEQIEVFVMIDGFGSQNISTRFINHYQKKGIYIKIFNPIHSRNRLHLGRRLHHKIVVIDGEMALIGGINISDKYNSIDQMVPWLDFAIFFQGLACKQVERYCEELWEKGYSNLKSLNHWNPKDEIENKIKISLRNNDWLYHHNEISESYLRLFRNSEKEIIIIGSYFIPGRTIRRMIKKTAQRGVKIKLIVAGKSDVRISKNAERWLYDWLIRHQVEIYEYQTSILHGKLAIADQKWLTLGSYNLNDISTYSSLEMNVDIHDNFTAKALHDVLIEMINNESIHVNKKYHLQHKNIATQLIRWLSYQFYRFLFHLFTFNLKRQSS